MRILVTGGAGFIGSHIVDRFLDRGDEVLVIDNLMTGRLENLNPDADFVEAEYGDSRGLMETEMFKPERVVHCAASYRNPRAWSVDAETNVLQLACLLEVLRDLGTVERFVYFQTVLCYGINTPRMSLPENWAIAPVGSYAITKTAAEGLILGSGLDAISFRLANMYGPRNRSGPIPAFYKKAMADEPCIAADSRRDYVYIEDALGLFEEAIEGRGLPGAYHVATGRDYPISALAELVWLAATDGKTKILIEEVPRSADDAPSILLDPRKTEREFGWTASTRIDFGIAKTVSWYQQHEVGETYTHLSKIGGK